MKRALFILMFALLLGSASAALNVTVVHHDTDVQSTYDHIKVCSCGTTVDVVRVKNIGQLEATYVFQLVSEESWFTLGTQSVYLLPGQIADIPVFIHAPCGVVDTGVYSLHVASEYGRYRVVEKSVESGVCENILASVAPTEATIQPCSEQIFTFNVTNIGTFQEEYQFTGMEVAPITLDAGESRLVYGGYTAACNEWGDKKLPVTVHSALNGLAVDLPVRIHVPRAYNYNVQVTPPLQTVCVGVESTVTVSIENVEDRDNTFLISANGVTANVSVAAHETESVALGYTPQEDGDHVYAVTVRSVNGALEKTVSVPLAVEACYGVSVAAPAQASACAGSLQVPFTITSSGTKPQQFNLDVRSNTTTSIDDLNASINPGAQLTKMVSVDIPNGDREYYVTLAAQSMYTSAEATTLVQGYSNETCYRVAPTNHKFTVYTDQVMLPVVIRHTGVQPATYNVSYNGTFMTPVEQNITLLPDLETVLHFAINSTDYETGRYVDRLMLSANGVDYVTDFEIKLEEKGFWQQFRDAVAWNHLFAFCSVVSFIAFVLLLLVLFLVIGLLTGKVYYENPTSISKATAGWVGGLLIILFLVLMIVSGLHIPRAYERPLQPSNASALFYEMGQGEELTIDLSQYFTDPDHDTLTYSANQPENLRIAISGTDAIVSSRPEFSGKETLVFTASDNRGGITDSNLITISVVPYKPVTLLQYWIYACWFLAWLFLLLVTIILLMVIIFTPEKRKREPRKDSIVLYRHPRTEVARSHAHDLVETSAPRTIAVPTHATQVNAEKIIINQGNTEQLWVASEDGSKFHRITCPVIKNMPTDKRVVFNAREDAIKAGYTPCKTCSSHE
jgi:uncharacterized membrane protein